MKNELIKKAKSGDLEAIKSLINQSFQTQGVNVKNIESGNGVLTVELRSMKGTIDQSTLDRIKSNLERLDIYSINDIKVYQFQSKNIFVAETNNSSNSNNLQNFGTLLFVVGLIMMGIGLIYDPSVGSSYNIGAISFKETYTNTGGFLAVCGAIFINSKKIDKI